MDASVRRTFTGAAHRQRRAELGDFSADRRLLMLAAMASCIGAAGALAAWALVQAIALATNAVWFGRLSAAQTSMADVARTPWMVLAPALGGLVIGLLARFGSEKIRGHGIPEAIEAILAGGSRMSPKVAVLKPLSSAVSIGSGGPFGAEGPVIMTGGAIGSLLAQCFHLSAAERKCLLVAGAAAGMTAIFGTPAAAVLLAVELLLFEWKPRSFVPVVVAVMVSIALRPLLLGEGPLFPARLHWAGGWWSLPACVGVGVLLGLQSGLLTTLLYRIEDAFERLPIHWMWWPALGGLVVGLGGLVEPRALGVGYDILRDLLADHLVVRTVITILLVKGAIWLVALASGTSGGVLAPLLILGGAAGSLVGLVLPGGPAAWALLGMAGMMGGTMRAPLTGALFAVELTGDFGMLAPLLAVTTTAYAVTVLLLRRSILTEKIARRGGHVVREYGLDPFELTRVGEVMVREVESLSAAMRVGEAVAFFSDRANGRRTYPVLDAEGRPVGLASRSEALRWRMDENLWNASLEEVVSDASLPLAHPDDVVAQAVDLMVAADAGRLPVVDPSTGKLVGLLARKDVLRLRQASAALERERAAFLLRPPRATARQT